MNRDLEKYLWDEIGKNSRFKPWPRDVIDKMLKAGLIESPKQAWRTLEKWCDKGWYDYGSCLDLGWKCCDERVVF